MNILCIATHFVDSENVLTEQLVSLEHKNKTVSCVFYESHCTVECCSSCHVNVCGKSESGKGVSTVERKNC